MASQPEVLQNLHRGDDGTNRGPSLFLSTLVLSGAAVLAILYFLAGPEREGIVSGRQGGADAIAVAAPTAPDATSGPRANGVVSLRVGPSDLHQVIGLVPAGAPLEVLGRSEDATWLAVAVAPGSSLYAWLPAAGVRGRPNLEGLPVLPVIEVDVR